MPQIQQYKLRLTEGTLLVVDHDALSSWLADEKALVQPIGSQRWRLLKQFLADERAGIGAPPERPRLSRGESARAQPVVAPAPHEEEDNEIFAPDLTDDDASPWEWALDPIATAPETVAQAPTSEPEPEPQDFEFPNDDILTLDDLVAQVEAAPSAPPSAPEPPPPEVEALVEPALATAPARVQVLADELAASPAVAGPEIPMTPVVPVEEPLEVVNWGPGFVGRFCCAVANWSDTLADWLDRGKEVAAHRHEYASAVLQAGPRVGARVRAMPAAADSLFVAWRELIGGWIAQTKAWWSERATRKG